MGMFFGGAQYSFTTYLPLFLLERGRMLLVLAASLLAHAQVGARASRVPMGWRLILDSRVVIGQFWCNRLFLQAFHGGRDRGGIFGKSLLISNT